MASQISSEPPQPSQNELYLTHAQNSDIPYDTPVQIPSKNNTPDSNLGNIDTKPDQLEKGTGSESVADGKIKEIPKGANHHQNAVQKLKDRMDGLEQRLWQAGLLDKPDDQNQLRIDSQEPFEPNTPELKEGSRLLDIGNGASSPSSHPEMGDNESFSQLKGPTKDTYCPDESVQTLVGRIDSLERRLEESGRLESWQAKDEPAAEKPRMPAIPQLHYVEWSEFKNKLVEDRQSYAIEVLVGGAKYYHQRSEEERKAKPRSNGGSNDRDQPITDHKKSILLPERIRINSKPIILIMSQIDPEFRSEKPPVILRPFKPLIYHEARIREVFQRLLTRWRSGDVEAPSKQVPEAPIMKEEGDNTTPAKSDGLAGSVSFDTEAESKAEAVPDHMVGSDSNTVSQPDETAKSSDSIYPPSTAKISQSSLPTVNRSIEQSTIVEGEKDSTKASPKIESRDIRKEQTEDLTDSLEALRDLRCLIEFIDVELKPVAESYRNMARQKVPFCDLWHLFKPGDLLYCPLKNKPFSDYVYRGSTQSPQGPYDRFQEVWRVAHTTGGRPHLEECEQNYESTGTSHKSRANALVVTAIRVDFNATRFISLTFQFYMKPYPGERDITTLHVYPLRYAPKVLELKSKWKARGEAFREYTTFKYRYYTGKTLTSAPDGYHTPEDDYPKHSESIDSQVVVDFQEAFAAHPRWLTSLHSFELPPESAQGELSEDYPTSYWKDSNQKVLDHVIFDLIYHDEHIDTKLMDEYIESDPLVRDHEQISSAENYAIDENDLVLLPNRVFAFVMKNRNWAMLNIDGLRPIKRYDGGLRDLQLPMGHKRTISSLVGNHFINRDAGLDDLEASHDADLVRGKGKGLLILLHGAPGVGKTSTAETVADAFGRLLLPITCGDLGLTATNVEKELSEKFHLAELWDCVLLLDEADVFLARRTNTDIKRNSLVSVFLRVLEHFTGVLFLTTNRVGAFDEAFKSRIHVSLYYPPLDAERTWSIWKTNLQRLMEKKQRRNESILFNEDEIYAYARRHYFKTFPRGANWNGRQIRNAFQTASALAEFEAHERNKKAKTRSMETGKLFTPADPQLKVSHFEEIARASYDFDEYISETKGFTEAEIAYLEGQRTDEYQPSRKSERDRGQQPTRLSGAPARILVPSHATRAKVYGQATAAGRTFDGGDRQLNTQPLVDLTYDATEGQEPRYGQPRETNPVNPYRARTVAPLSQGERSSIVPSRPKTVQPPGSFASHDRVQQRPVAFAQSEPQYEYGEYEDTEYEQAYEGPSSEPMSTQVRFEDTNQHELSPRRRQTGDIPVMGRKSAVPTYVEDFEDDEDTFNM